MVAISGCRAEGTAGQIFSPTAFGRHSVRTYSTTSHKYRSMAEPEVATKAPENDAAEQSLFPNDSRAQEGASMGVGETPILERGTQL